MSPSCVQVTLQMTYIHAIVSTVNILFTVCMTAYDWWQRGVKPRQIYCRQYNTKQSNHAHTDRQTAGSCQYLWECRVHVKCLLHSVTHWRDSHKLYKSHVPQITGSKYLYITNGVKIIIKERYKGRETCYSPSYIHELFGKQSNVELKGKG